MGRVISGTGQNKKFKVVKAAGNNVSKVRCPHCQHTLCHPVPDGKGGTVLQCGSCNKKFISRTM